MMRSVQGRIVRSLSLSAGVLAMAGVVTWADASTPTPFGPAILGPIGLAATTDRVLVTYPWCTGDPTSDPTQVRHVLQINGDGTSQPFADLLPRLDLVSGVSNPNCGEEYIAVSPGYGSFLGKAGYVYVHEGYNIVEIAPDGTGAHVFATLPPAANLEVDGGGLTFDTTGTWNYDLLVAGQDGGEVWAVDGSGNSSCIIGKDPSCRNEPSQDPQPGATTADAEGITVAPLDNPSYPGYIFVTNEDTGGVWAIAPDGNQTKVATTPGLSAEAAAFVPPVSDLDRCTLPYTDSTGATTDLAFFTTQYLFDIANNLPDQGIGVVAYPKSDVDGLSGHLLLTQEYNAIDDYDPAITSPPAVFDGPDGIQREDGSFVQCPRRACSDVQVTPDTIWPPNHKFVDITITADGNPVPPAGIYAIYQDEPLLAPSTGNFTPDAQLDPLAVRAERAGSPQVGGDGRIYHIFFTGADSEGTCVGQVDLCVPHDQGNPHHPVPVECTDSGAPWYNSVTGDVVQALPQLPSP
jgi:hypothetical protein